MRAGARSRQSPAEEAGQIAGEQLIEERVSSPDGQVSGMAGSE
jgi:hypothetical protein